jgi:hypothetical protein
MVDRKDVYSATELGTATGCTLKRWETQKARRAQECQENFPHISTQALEKLR